MSVFLPAGFRFAGASGGIKAKPGTKDVTLVFSERPAVAAGVYTQNQVVAAPVVLCKQRTPSDVARLVVINSGNANACTGEQGMADAVSMCQLASKMAPQDLPFSQEQTLVMSTGVIGKQLPMERVESGIKLAGQRLEASEEAFLDAADGILTTDIARKITSRQLVLGGKQIRIAGMAKGAGMIGPNMATMLCCIVTDAKIERADADAILKRVANHSFNNISVEGHTSTNDTMLLLANGAADGDVLKTEDLEQFERELTAMCIELAKLIPADGEGATHLIEVQVSGAASDADARKIATVVANSNLVKTAIYGNDPNWGRIVSAAGYAGVPIDPAALALRLNDILLFEGGEPVTFDESLASASLKNEPEAIVALRVGSGSGQCTHWTSDLSVAYVQFNSEYTT